MLYLLAKQSIKFASLMESPSPRPRFSAFAHLPRRIEHWPSCRSPPSPCVAGASPRGCLGEPGTPISPNILFGTPRFCRILTLALWFRPSQTSPWLPQCPSYASLLFAGPALKFLWRCPCCVGNPQQTALTKAGRSGSGSPWAG